MATPYGISYFEDKDNNNVSNCDLKITDLIVDGIDVLNANKTELITIEINDKNTIQTETGTEVIIRFPKSFMHSKPINK